MKVSASWIITFGLVAAAALLLSLYQLLGWTGPVILLAFIFSVAFVYVIQHLFFVHIGELEFGVVFKRHTGNFSRFLDSNNRYFINPLNERLTDRIKRGAQKAETTITIRTKEGIPVEIKWAVSFKVNVHNIKKEIRFKLARSLPKSADKIVGGKAVQSLRHIVEQKSVQELYHQDSAKLLEKQLCDQLNARLQLRHKEAYSTNGVSPIPALDKDAPIQGLGFEPIPWFDVHIVSIEMPEQIEKALEAAHERRLQTETAAAALESLRRVVTRYSDKDMERLAELERLRVLDGQGGSLVYLMASLAKTMQQAGNGVGAQSPGQH